VERNYPLALREHDRAIALSPGYATAHNWRSEALLVVGRTDEAIAEAQRAIALDPITPFPHYFLAQAREIKGDIVQAEKDYQAARSISRGFPMGDMYVRMLIRQGRLAEARKVAEDMVAANSNAFNIASLAVVQALSGHRQDAIANAARVRAIAAQQWVSPLEFACIDAALGNRDDALRHFREAIDARDFRIPIYAVSVGPEFDAFKDDVEFQKLIAMIREPAS
jgi:tetratricopeptide (TPR) repeat protein